MQGFPPDGGGVSPRYAAHRGKISIYTVFFFSCAGGPDFLTPRGSWGRRRSWSWHGISIVLPPAAAVTGGVHYWCIPEGAAAGLLGELSSRSRASWCDGRRRPARGGTLAPRPRAASVPGWPLGPGARTSSPCGGVGAPGPSGCRVGELLPRAGSVTEGDRKALTLLRGSLRRRGRPRSTRPRAQRNEPPCGGSL